MKRIKYCLIFGILYVGGERTKIKSITSRIDSHSWNAGMTAASISVHLWHVQSHSKQANVFNYLIMRFYEISRSLDADISKMLSKFPEDIWSGYGTVHIAFIVLEINGKITPKSPLCQGPASVFLVSA
jgi:hypothetical protein